MLAHMSLAEFYEIEFTMKAYHNWSLSEIENLFPWERATYLILIEQYIEKKKRMLES